MSATRTPRELELLLRRLARLQWEDYSWKQCGEELQIDTVELENLTIEHTELWQSACAVAYAEYVERSLRDSVRVLQKQMQHNSDPKHQREAAKALSQLMIKARPKSAINNPVKPVTKPLTQAETKPEMIRQTKPEAGQDNRTPVETDSHKFPTGPFRILPVVERENTLAPLNAPLFPKSKKTLEEELWETAEVLLAETGLDMKPDRNPSHKHETMR